MRGVKRKRTITPKEVMAWAEQHPLVKNWLAKLQVPELRGYLFAMFCEWAKKTPEELYALKDDRNNLEAEYLLDALVADKKAPFTDHIKWGMIQAVKSFFSHNYRDLAKKSGQMIVTPKKPQRKPTKEELYKLWKSCKNPRDHALITFVNSTAIAKETLRLLKWGNLEEGWENQEIPHIGVPDVMLKGHGVGRWEGVEQHTFLTPEAKRDLIEYKEWLEEKIGRKLTKEDPLFVDLHSFPQSNPLTHSGIGVLIWKLARRPGVPFSWHDARRYVQTALEETKMNPNWIRKIKGRKVRGEENPYSKPEIEKLCSGFKEAVPLLQFTTPVERPKISKEEIIEKLPDEILGQIAEEKGVSISDVRRLLIRKAKERPREQARLSGIEISRYTKKKREQATNGGNPINCQKIVSEDELEVFLSQGWQVKSVLPSGKIVISLS